MALNYSRFNKQILFFNLSTEWRAYQNTSHLDFIDRFPVARQVALVSLTFPLFFVRVAV
jgi:hypothetical protein